MAHNQPGFCLTIVYVDILNSLTFVRYTQNNTVEMPWELDLCMLRGGYESKVRSSPRFSIAGGRDHSEAPQAGMYYISIPRYLPVDRSQCHWNLFLNIRGVRSGQVQCSFGES